MQQLGRNRFGGGFLPKSTADFHRAFLGVRLRSLTDVVVLLAHVELVAQREGAVPLELLRELDGSVRGVRPVALPALEALLGVAHAVAAVADHVKDVLLGHGALQRPPRGDVVMWAVDVQVVIDADLHRVPLPPQPEITHRADGIMGHVLS